MSYEEMITHKFHGGHDITIIPVSDVHFGAQECMEEEFRKFIQHVQYTPNVYLTLGGDLINNSTRSSVASPFDEKYRPFEQKREMTGILEPVRDRILCFVPGNHEDRSRKDADDDPVYDIAAKLDLEHLYRDSIAFLAIEMGLPTTESGGLNAGRMRPIYTVVVTHGAGGGMLTGGSVNRTERFGGQAITNFDVLITGHTHKPYITYIKKLVPELRTRMVRTEQAVNISGTSWLKYGGYAAKKMLTPAAHTLQKVILFGDSKHVEVRTSDLIGSRL